MKQQPLSVVVFGEPRPFFVQGADIISSVPNRSYLNMSKDGHDYVWSLPAHLDPFFPYVHGGECAKNPTPPRTVSQEPPANDPWGLFKFHHSYLYRQAIAALSPMPITAVTPLPVVVQPQEGEVQSLVGGGDQPVAVEVGVTDLDAIGLVDSLYAYPTSAKVDWDHLDTGTDDGVYWGAKKLNGIWVIVNRGSANPLDFQRDLYALVQNTRDIGPVHAGFYQGSKDQHEEISALVGEEPLMFVGHSLGAARAQIQTALWCASLTKGVFAPQPATTGTK